MVGQLAWQRSVSAAADMRACRGVSPPRFRDAVCRYEPIAQNGFVNLPSQLKIDKGYYGNGFYFTRFPRSRIPLLQPHV